MKEYDLQALLNNQEQRASENLQAPFGLNNSYHLLWIPENTSEDISDKKMYLKT